MHAGKMSRFGWAVLVVCAVSVPAFAEDPPQDLTDPFYSMQNPKRTLRGAELTEGQMNEILQYRKATTWEREKQIVKERDALWHRFDELYMAQGPLNEAELLSLSERSSQLSLEEEQLKTKVMFKMRSVLSPEQLKRVIDTHQKVRDLDSRKQDLESQKRALEPTVAAERGK
jgi:Spy/CpxP family protein refolding chaperone